MRVSWSPDSASVFHKRKMWLDPIYSHHVTPHKQGRNIKVEQNKRGTILLSPELAIWTRQQFNCSRPVSPAEALLLLLTSSCSLRQWYRLNHKIPQLPFNSRDIQMNGIGLTVLESRITNNPLFSAQGKCFLAKTFREVLNVCSLFVQNNNYQWFWSDRPSSPSATSGHSLLACSDRHIWWEAQGCGRTTPKGGKFKPNKHLV